MFRIIKDSVFEGKRNVKGVGIEMKDETIKSKSNEVLKRWREYMDASIT